MSFHLKVRSQFSAGHALRNYPGKCEKLHGHNFEVEVVIQGEELDHGTGMLVDFAILKKALSRVLEPLDHTILNDLQVFGDISPSSENLAKHIGKELELVLDDTFSTTNTRLHSISVSEKPTQTAVWYPE